MFKWYTTRWILVYTITISALLSVYLISPVPFTVAVVPVMGALANHKHQETKQQEID